MKKIFLWGLVVSLITSGLLAIFIFLFASFHEREVKILFSTLDIGACSLAGLCCSTMLNSKFKIIGILGIIAAAVCMFDLLYTIWGQSRNDNFDILLSLVILALSFSHISLILLTKTESNFVVYILAVTVLFITLIAAMLLMLVWHTDQPELFYRLLGVFGILDVLGTIITPILGKTQKIEDALD